MAKILPDEGLTFDDVLLVPQRSRISSRKEISTSTPLSRNIRLNIPVVSANMDTVTEAEMAIAMAREGGIGIIHRFLPIEKQVAEVKKVKSQESYIIENPVTLPPDETVEVAKKIMDEFQTSVLVTSKKGKLLGILTHRDVKLEEDLNKKISSLMTKELITARPGISLEQAKKILHKHRIEKLPIVDKEGNLGGLVTGSAILKRIKYPHATRDKHGRLSVGAAIGVRGDYLERAYELFGAGVDGLVVDIAHGHADHTLKVVKEIKKEFPQIDVIAGNIATTQGATDLIKAGADAVKVGVGPGSVCTTRIVAGAGVPQLTATMDIAKITEKEGVPIIADGGIRSGGDIVKALAAGASTVMIGGLLAGTEESPGAEITREGRRFKLYRGMAGLGANLTRKSLTEKEFPLQEFVDEVTPEGIDALVPYRGKVTDVLDQLIGGLKSGMSYSNAKTIPELWGNAVFIKITQAGLKESYPHDVERL